MSSSLSITCLDPTQAHWKQELAGECSEPEQTHQNSHATMLCRVYYNVPLFNEFFKEFFSDRPINSCSFLVSPQRNTSLVFPLPHTPISTYKQVSSSAYFSLLMPSHKLLQLMVLSPGFMRRNGWKRTDALELWCDDLMIAVGFLVREKKQWTASLIYKDRL